MNTKNATYNLAVAVTAALLLAGCQLGKHEKHKAPAVEQTQATVDTTEEEMIINK